MEREWGRLCVKILGLCYYYRGMFEKCGGCMKDEKLHEHSLMFEDWYLGVYEVHG